MIGIFHYIYDLNANITIVFTNYENIFTKMEIFFPKTLLDGAEGLVVDGFPELDIDLGDLRNRKRRSID